MELGRRWLQFGKRWPLCPQRLGGGGGVDKPAISESRSCGIES